MSTIKTQGLKVAVLACSLTLLGCASTESPEAPEVAVKDIQAKAGTPASKHDLSGWSLNVPVDTNKDDKLDLIQEKELATGYSHSDVFYLAEDGGMVFKAPVKGAKTSKNIKYSRSELREMLRKGDTLYRTKGVSGNNWVLSTAPLDDLQNAGGVDGTLDATLSVDHVTTTGVNWRRGRVVIGQVVANKSIPIRLYYRKLPQHENGSIYFSHEPNGGNEIWVDVLGTSLPNQWNKDATPENPKDGIKLGEKFSYRIKVDGHRLAVTIMRPGKIDITKIVDMRNIKYDIGGQYMFFKAGVYNRNKTGEANDFVQATFYNLKTSHSK